MKLKKLKQSILRFLGNHFLYYIINLLCKSLNIVSTIPPKTKELISNNSSCVYAFWHGTMLAPWYVNKNKNITALVSLSKDGEILTRILNKWGYILERGSSNMNGKEALELLVQKAKNHSSIALTPDGPKGPEKEFKAGAVIIAKKAHLPLILVGVKNKNKYTLKSWDKFEIPKFFSTVLLSYSEPIYIDSNISYEETSKLIVNCGIKLNNLQLAEK